MLVTTMLPLVLYSCTKPSAISVSAVTLNPTSVTINEGETVNITATISPSNASNQKVIWSSSDAHVASVSDGKVTGISKGSATITATADDNGKTAQCSVSVNAKSGDDNGGTNQSITAIDLGLSVKWANFNLGATTQEGYGDYYAWGETKTKTNYDWTTYKWCNGTMYSLTKYNTLTSNGSVDNKTTLELEDDVAHTLLGSKWRIPTKAEWEELEDECQWQEMTHNLVMGYLITGKNGNKIFLPAAGYKSENEFYGANKYYHYYSSSLREGVPEHAWECNCTGECVGSWRNNGYPIRSVFGESTQIEKPDEPAQDAISITISNITQSKFSVSFSTKSLDTYYTCALLKSQWDEIDNANNVCDYYINEDLKNGILNQYLYSGNQTDTYSELDSKTAYVVFAAFCNSNGKRSGQVYYTFVTTK